MPASEKPGARALGGLTAERLKSALRHPARLIVGSFALGVFIGTILLMLPIASEAGTWTRPVTALFTATSAITVTGLVVVDTDTHWSVFGEVAILLMIQAGGLGLMTLASLMAIFIARRMRLRMQMVTQSETRSLDTGDFRSVVLGIVRITIMIEVVLSLILAVRYYIGYEQSVGEALYFGVFHGVSAFNNAGFVTSVPSLVHFDEDPWLLSTIAVGSILGGLGFPVLFEVGRHLRRQYGRRGRSPKHWSLHTKVTLITYFGLLAFGVVSITALEWSNPQTFGPMPVGHKLHVGFFHGVVPRSSGFNAIDYGQAESSTLFLTDVLMFIGGGSAGTAGGIKVTTFALLWFVILAELRGQPAVHVLGRKLAPSVQRQAITVALMSVAGVMSGTIALLLLSDFDLENVLFEAISAFATCGLSTGITGQLPEAGQVILSLMMFAGRLGPVTLASALALRERARLYELPEERTLVG